MQVNNAARWAPRGPHRWGAAILALAAASGIRLLIHPFVGPAVPGSVFCIAAAVVEYQFGIGPALTVMWGGLAIADYMFVPPYEKIEVFTRADAILFTSYSALTLVMISLIERLRRTQFKTELIGSVAQSRYEMLLRMDNERLLARRATDETHRLLHHLTHYHEATVLIQAIDRETGGAAVATPADSTAPPEGEAPLSEAMLVELVPGSRSSMVHPDDLVRLRRTLSPGSHRLRLHTGRDEYRLADCVCERFTTHLGDFLVLRVAQ